MPEQILSTSFGKFIVTITEDIQLDMMTRERRIEGYILSLGGKNKCVQLNIPLVGEVAHLLIVKAKDGGCDIANDDIRGDKMVKLILLAFTIIRQKWHHIKHIKLEDKSSFDCKLSNDINYTISLTTYEILLRHKTWYEGKFGAYLVNPDFRAIYESAKANFEKPHPSTFNFKNTTLNEFLRPIFASTTTWKEFFDVIKAMENRCEVMSAWYQTAAKDIMGAHFEGQEWYIDLIHNSLIQQIPYKVENKGGSRRRTRRRAYNGRGGALESENMAYIYNRDLSYDVMYNMELPAVRKMIEGSRDEGITL